MPPKNRHKSSIFGWHTVFDNDSSYLAGENQTGGDIRIGSTVTSCRFFAVIGGLNQLNRLAHKGLLVWFYYDTLVPKHVVFFEYRRGLAKFGLTVLGLMCRVGLLNQTN